jgi:hypothetical protein
MQSRICTSGLLLLTCLLSVADDAQAWPLRLRNGNRNYGGGGGGSVRVAPKADPDSAGHRPLRVDYGYERAKALDVAWADRIRVFLRVRDEQIANAKEGLVAEVKLTDLSNSATTHVKWCPVSFDSNGAVQNEELATFEVANEKDESVIQPQKVYRLFVNLHRKSATHGEDTVLGRVPGPYYVATSGDTLLQRARQQIAMRTFREWYCTERGWPRDRGYRMDCHAYYLWATGFCTVGSSYGQANLGRLFRGRTPYLGGSEIDDLTPDEPIHGDYVRIPGHTFMLLAYDENLGRVWTMEGNFGSSIEIAIRSVGSGWQVGHLAEEHIRPDAFEDTPESERGESLAATESAEQPAIE